MKYHKFFYTTEPEAMSFVESIQGDFQHHVMPLYSNSEEDEAPVILGYMVDVAGRSWTADMSHEVRPNTHLHWFAGDEMKAAYYNSINQPSPDGHQEGN